jgi:ADP-heptose:LPS heptosyltransferase
VEFCRLWAKRRARPVRFLLLGLPRIAGRAAFLREKVGEDVIDLVGRDTPGEAFAILQRATLVLSEDSGLMHLAWVAGAPTLALFGASRTAWARPHGNYGAVIASCREPDGGCLHGVCLAGSPHCLAGHDADSVVDRALQLLDSAGRLPKLISSSDGVP